MKKRTAALLMVFLFSCGAARADMIEIKGRGILNGKILSQDGNGVQFKESTGNVLTVPKSDILFLEAQKDAPPAPVRKKSFRLSGWLKGARSEVGRWVSEARYRIRKFTNKAREFASTPLDRSDTDQKAKLLADTMEEATNNIRKMAARDRAQTANVKIAKAYYAKDASERAPEETTKGASYTVSKDAQFSLD